MSLSENKQLSLIYITMFAAAWYLMCSQSATSNVNVFLIWLLNFECCEIYYNSWKDFKGDSINCKLMIDISKCAIIIYALIANNLF